MDQRSDQQKYTSGCRTMENMVPLIYGGCTERPGLEFIASQKTASATGRVVPFEHSVDDTYILLLENQGIRFFKNGAQVLTGGGTEDLSALNNIIAHWKLNDNASNTAVVDADGATHNGVASANTEDIHAEGKVGTGSFDLNGENAVSVTDSADFTFVEGVDGDFSIAGWVRVTDAGALQTILSKWDETLGSQGREWKLLLDESRKLKIILADESLLLDSDLIGHWKLNDSAQTATVADATGNHGGTLSDGDNNYTSDHSVASKSGSNMVNAFDFDGTNDSVKIDDAAVLSFGDASSDSAFSISAWIKMDDATSFEIISKLENAKEEWRFFVDSSDKLAGWCIDSTTDNYIGRKYNTAITSSEGSWIHVVMTYDATETSSGVTLYIDGSATDDLDDNTGAYTAMHATAADVYIGFTHKNTIYADGKIDNVMLFNKELSQAEVTALYNSGNGMEELNTVFPSRISDDALSIGWRFVAMTYEGQNNSQGSAADDILLYVDGAVVASTATNLATYSKMEDTAAKPRIGAQFSSAGAIENIWSDKIDNVAIFGDVLTPAEIAGLFDATAVFEVTSPYLTADLFELKFEQSADVMFITHQDYEPRRLSRLADDDWLLEASDLQTGPFRDQNTDTAKTITASATTGSVTLTAVGHAPFVAGTTAGHLPSGSLNTSKSQTGALFKLVQATSLSHISGLLDPTGLNSTTTLAIPKGVTWDLVTNGTWGQAADSATIVLERSYDSEVTYETVVSFTSAANFNISTDGTEDFADAIYRLTVTEATAGGSACSFNLSVRDTSHIGIVEITAVASGTSATATVLTTLASTDPTHRFSEGSFSNRRGWPIDVTISSEERLTFAGNLSEPLTTWGSVIGDFTDFKDGTDDDDALTLTLIGSGQQNRIRWLLSKNTLVLGTVGGEHILGASKDDEALTPSNIRTRLQTTYGSENIAAKIVNQAVLFVQRGGRKIREFLYNFEQDSHKADDLTVFSEHITESGIVDMAFQRTPDPILWCVRSDGEMATMTYERDQNVFSWSRLITQTNLAGTASDSDFESVAVIYGGAGNEDEVWVTVRRTISGSDVRYVERFFQRKMPSSISDMKYLDSFITDTGGNTTIEGLTHLVGQTVQVLGDGLAQATKVVNGSGVIIAATTASKYQVGVGYTATVKPMKLDLNGMGLAITKKINRGVFSVFETIGGEVGTSTSKLHDIPTGTAALFTGSKEIPLSGGYSREGDILARQTQPLPLTVLSFSLDVGANAD